MQRIHLSETRDDDGDDDNDGDDDDDEEHYGLILTRVTMENLNEYLIYRQNSSAASTLTPNLCIVIGLLCVYEGQGGDGGVRSPQF